MECCGKDETYLDGSNCCTGPVERRRQNTAYIDDESNFVTCCDYHFEEIQKRWDEMWADYWSDRL